MTDSTLIGNLIEDLALSVNDLRDSLSGEYANELDEITDKIDYILRIVRDDDIKCASCSRKICSKYVVSCNQCQKQVCDSKDCYYKRVNDRKFISCRTCAYGY